MEVARRLRSLDSHGWTFLHDLTIGSRGANLDHLAIGPGGVFALNTKNHRGKKIWVGERAVLVNGHKTDYLRGIQRETTAVEKALSRAMDTPVVVRGVIVVLADELKVKQQPRVASVVGRKHIARWLRNQPSVLPDDVVEAIARAARLPSTWGLGTPGGVLDSQPPSPDATSPPGARDADLSPLDGITVKRWTRYGKDRLYVNDAGGQTLGYLDRLTGELHVDSDSNIDVVRAAVSAHCASNGGDRD